jgi:GrpB-like predicted nucleotidyltransferase (UPF0157 family)
MEIFQLGPSSGGGAMEHYTMNDQESLLAAIYEEVRLCPYDPQWPHLFQAERERLMEKFPGAFRDIEHIGSTAVPGLQAKPVIDILAGVESMAFADKMVNAICLAGYTTSDAFNATLSGRRWFMRSKDGTRTHHLHVVVHGESEWLEHLCFRDALRSDVILAARYVELKSELVAHYKSDRDAYTDAKTLFVQSVLRNA